MQEHLARFLSRILYLPSFLSEKEKKVLAVVSIVFLISGIWLAVEFVKRNTFIVPAVGGTYREGIVGDPRLPNPILGQSSADQDIAQLVYAGLMEQTPQGDIQPNLAQTMDVSPDGKQYLFTLKKGLTWPDGKPFTAEDVVFTIRMIQNPRTKSPLRASWQGVEAVYVDETRVKFVLRDPYAQFPENATVGILPKHLWEEIAPQNFTLADLNFRPVGMGPFQVSSVIKTQAGTVELFIFERNPDYFKEGPYLNFLELHFSPSQELMLLAWHKGELDGLAGVDTSHFGEVTSSQHVLIRTLNLPRVIAIFFNQTKSKVLASQKVRQALLLATSRGDIIQGAFMGKAVAAQSPLPHIAKGYQALQSSDVSIEKAQQLLAGDGWKDENGDGILEKKMTRRISAKETKTETLQLAFDLFTAETPELVKTAELLRDAWKKIGVAVNVRSDEITDLSENYLRPRNYDAVLLGQVYGFTPDPFPFWNSSQKKDPGLNLALYDTPDADKAIDLMRTSTNSDERISAAATFQQLVAQELPAIFLVEQPFLWATTDTLKGIGGENALAPSKRFIDVNRWYLKTQRVWNRPS